MSTRAAAALRWALLGALAAGAVVLTALQPAAAEPEWTVAAQLAHPRAYGTAVSLPTGEVLLFGGMDEQDPAVVNLTTELFDPMSGNVRTLAQPLPGRLHHTITPTLVQDRLVVAGGVEWYSGAFHSSSRVDVYLPYQHAWARAAALHQARSDHGAAPLPGGAVLVTGGNFNTVPLSSSEIYDPVADRWREAAPLPEPRLRFSTAALPDGRILVAGGLSRTGVPLATTAIYDPAADRWVRGPDLSVPRVQHTVVTLAGGDLLFIGGQSGASNTAERYDVARGVFSYAGTLARPRLVQQAASLPDGRVVITGGSLELPGRQAWVPVADAEIWDPRTNEWSVFASPTQVRALGQLIATRTGLYLFNGVGDGLSAQRSIERFPFR